MDLSWEDTTVSPRTEAGGTNARAEFVERRQCINCRSEKLEPLSSGGFHDNPLRNILASEPWGENPLPYLEGKRWTFVECQDCGQYFHRDVLSPEWNEIRFTRWMTHEAIQACLQHEMVPAALFRKAMQNTQHVLRLEKLTRRQRKDHALRILDFGCGYGEFLAMCRQYGYEAFGVDRSTGKRLHARHPTIFAELGELVAEIGKRKFHAITLFETLEHLDDPRSILEQLADLILPGGILILETPDCTGVTDIKDPKESWRIQPLDHINGFTPATLRSIAERCGYRPRTRPEAHVTTGPQRAAKTEAKRLLGALGLLKPTTQQYFRKT